MKKKALCAAIAAAFVLTTAGTVFANGVEFNGGISYQFRQNTKDGADDATGTRFNFILNGTAPEVSKNIDLYFRIAGQRTNGIDGWRDFEVKNENVSDTSVFALDQFGFNYKNAGWNYKVGRQTSFIGATGILYDDTAAFGKHIFGDGITITGQTGAVDVKLSAVEFDFLNGANPKLYSASASYKANKDLTVGGTFAKETGIGDDLNIWTVNAGYNINDRLNVYGEYAKSNADHYDTAYAIGGSYNLDKKNTLWAVYSRVEEGASFYSQPTDNQSSTFDAGGKGMYYGVDHKFDKTTSLSFFYKDMTNIDKGTDSTSFRTTVSYKF
ncbi:porin [Anaerospora hongkongensis]|uniref:porin n=1 Tax=Anaerospora hongkongensis TaxID=244830 RepID=UPI0028A26BE7|nr:porin [Anaerospora hongkongensis]